MASGLLTMTPDTLTVSSYTRRAPYAEAKTRTTEQLRDEVAQLKMMREIARMVREELEREE